MKQVLSEKPYPLNPDDVMFDDKYVTYNPSHNDLEYRATQLSIMEKGQLTPIYMLGGLCVDGRHRTRICKELGIAVMAVDINPLLSEKEIIDLCNVETNTGRKLSPTQRAIYAYEYAVKYGVDNTKAAEIHQASRQSLSYVKSLMELGPVGINIVALLRENKSVKLKGMRTPSKNLSYLAKYAKEMSEVITKENSKPLFNPDAAIKTEAGKKVYYELVEALPGISFVPRIQELLIKGLNTEYQAEVDAEQVIIEEVK